MSKAVLKMVSEIRKRTQFNVMSVRGTITRRLRVHSSNTIPRVCGYLIIYIYLKVKIRIYIILKYILLKHNM